MIVKSVVLCILLSAPFAVWGALCALAKMEIKSTRPTIAAGFLSCVIGWGGLIFAALDYLTGAAPLFWPLAMLASVLMLSVGNAAIYLANRRACTCPACPARPMRIRREIW
jgi:uncharacterized membrane protein YfcA